MKKRMKKQKRLESAHTPRSPQGMGDFYGSGIRAKIGRMRDGIGFEALSKKQLSNPPKTFA
jgi:hypothetical protein